MALAQLLSAHRVHFAVQSGRHTQFRRCYRSANPVLFDVITMHRSGTSPVSYCCRLHSRSAHSVRSAHSIAHPGSVSTTGPFVETVDVQVFADAVLAAVAASSVCTQPESSGIPIVQQSHICLFLGHAVPTSLSLQISRESPLSSFNRYRALVLDTSYRPIDIVNWQRAICLDLFDKVCRMFSQTWVTLFRLMPKNILLNLQVDVLEYYDALVHSARHEFMIPAVLRVRMYVQRDHKGRISLTRRNLLLRDNSICQ